MDSLFWGLYEMTMQEGSCIFLHYPDKALLPDPFMRLPGRSCRRGGMPARFCRIVVVTGEGDRG